jgi:cysteine desulfurase/selenocysteine lyase
LPVAVINRTALFSFYYLHLMQPGNPIYLNTAACGLVTPATLEAANKLYAAFDINSSTRSEEWRMHEEGRIRQTIANFISAPVEHVAMVPNFSWAMNAVVQSLKGTERVLLYKHDYPSLLEPFRINKFDICWVDAEDGFHMDMAAIRDAIKNNTVDIVALSHVQWTSGYQIDIKEIGDLCKDFGVRFIVDATQSLGAAEITLPELHIDVFAASNYKWMNAAFGTGILYLSENFLAHYPPVVGGNNSYKLIGAEMKQVPSAHSYEPGHPNMYGLTVLEAAIHQKQMLGIQHIVAHNRALTQQLLTGIQNTPIRILGDYTLAHRSPIIFLADEYGLGEHIKRHNIVVTHRNDYLRVSMHYYNTEEDVQAFVDCVAAFKP